CYVYIVDMAELLGTFEQIVLLAVLGLDEEAYGRAVLRAAQTASGGDRTLSAGAVYATLDRLEAKGLLSSRVEQGTAARGGRARRFYRLTGDGASALSEARRALERMWQGKRWPLEVSA
ncbi:MAG TPA: PadR family transcriptional regulator, partial [Acidobacteriaceae bacterium]|nr:PadR family transcriptional regulator [Acidobacteriaceae bacterium]